MKADMGGAQTRVLENNSTVNLSKSPSLSGGWEPVGGYTWLRFWVIVCLTGMLLGFLSWRYGLPWYRSRTLARYCREMETYMRSRDYSRAGIRARQVLETDPANRMANAVLADIADLVQSPAALYWRRRVANLFPDSTNQLALASTALRDEAFPFSTAQDALEKARLAGGGLDVHLIAGALAVRQNLLTEAERHYKNALVVAPEDPTARLSLSVLQLQSRDASLATRARRTLEGMMDTPGVGLLATRSLLADRVARRDLKGAEELSTRLLKAPSATFEDTVVHLTIMRALQHPRFPEALESAKRRAVGKAPWTARLAAWMNEMRLPSETLKWIEIVPVDTRMDPMVLLATADAYCQLGLWSDLQRFLETSPWKQLEYGKYALLSLALERQSLKGRNSIAWSKALQLSSRSPLQLDTLSRLANAWGWRDESAEVLWFAVKQFPGQRWPLDRLERLYGAQGNTLGLLAVAKSALKQFPKDRAARNNCAILSLLLNQNTQQAEQLAEELHNEAPDDPVFASTYSYALLKRKSHAEALAVFKALPPAALENAGIAAYYGIALAALGDQAGAQTYLSKATNAFLLPEERLLVDQALHRRAN